MNVMEGIRIALRALSANKLRSGLTMLGIIIGVAAVIALMGIGQGAQQAIDSRIEGLGTNLLFVSPGSTNANGVRSAEGSAQTLTYADAQALDNPANAPDVAAVAPELDTFGQVVYQGTNINTRVVGVTPPYAQVRNMSVADGSFISQANLVGDQPVAVLGASVAQELFNGNEPVGKTIRIRNNLFRVAGVLQAKGGGGFGNQDDQIFVPLTAALERFSRGTYEGSPVVSMINVQAASANQSAAAIQEITGILQQRHHIRYQNQNDFTIRSEQDLLASANQVTGVLTLFLGGVAGISLVVGGIGIMNIMLVSVTERTREIGIRKAVGATRGNILSQFLTEATFLSVLGGILGILLGAGIARLVSGLSLGASPLHAVIEPSSVILATGFALAVGLFFGIYPAYRAATLNPIDALHYE
jgi:putative ABC transport system permease protein